MVFHRIVASQLGIFIFDGVEAMGASGHDRADVVSVEHLDVVERLYLEEEFVSRTAGRVTGTALLRAQHGKIDVQRLQDLDKGARHPLTAVVEGTGAANPK